MLYGIFSELKTIHLGAHYNIIHKELLLLQL